MTTAWQPAASAPDDGTPVLVSRWSAPGPEILVAQLVEVGVFNEYWSGERVDFVTHWAPLPEPPDAPCQRGVDCGAPDYCCDPIGCGTRGWARPEQGQFHDREAQTFDTNIESGLDRFEEALAKPEPPPMHRLSQGGFRFKP